MNDSEEVKLMPPLYLSFCGTGDVNRISFPEGTLMFAEIHAAQHHGTFCFRWTRPCGFTWVPDGEMTDSQKAEMAMYVLEREKKSA